ncbi:hypothetical protein SASPL_109155 [Salvia splendens]|uniref:Uncharacterized protein n=1 Tax=Salvia splendens TaxID=180675 RepID=A0A8X8YFT0_SALSN|nr:uncharacterized protein LOC121793823 [Salvia splendens]KAG6431080.1 hypothetical protein SASPL_109155 [Salvia splendens]
MILRVTKDLEETMKTVILTPNSSVKSSTTTVGVGSRENSYYPGCKKDANCNCEMCIASFNATLDLMPQTAQRSSRTKLSVSRPKIRRSPVPFASSVDVSTPKSRSPTNSQQTRKGGFKYEGFLVRLLFGLILVFGLEFGFSWMISGVLKSQLLPELVENMAGNSWVHEDLNGKFMFLKNELEGFVGIRVSTCNSANSVWKITQDGLLLNSRCVLYKSMAEEVSIWGWPLQTAGLLTAEYYSRSFSIINGRVTEWSGGKAGYFVRTANSSWVQDKWSSSVVQFDPNTWLLEYRQSFLLQNARPVSATLKFLKLRLTRDFRKMSQEFWLQSASFGGRWEFRRRARLTTLAPT